MSEQAPDTGTTEVSVTETTTVPDTDTTDYKAEAEKWKAQARKHEERAKANADAAKKVSELERQSMTEIEAAIAKAKDDTTTEVRAEFGTRLAGEAIRAAASGRVADVEALLEGVNASKFLDAEGNPDRDAITAWIDRIAPQTDEQQPATLPAGFYDIGQGARGPTATVTDPLEKALTDLSRR